MRNTGVPPVARGPRSFSEGGLAKAGRTWLSLDENLGYEKPLRQWVSMWGGAVVELLIGEGWGRKCLVLHFRILLDIAIKQLRWRVKW